LGNGLIQIVESRIAASIKLKPLFSGMFTAQDLNPLLLNFSKFLPLLDFLC